jgi:hypothetical protein
MLYDRRKDLPAGNLVLLEAADLLRERGWCQHFLSDGGRFCAEGAIRKAAEGTLAKTSLKFIQARGLLKKHLGAKYIAVWNDDPRRTKKQVIEALEAAAWSECNAVPKKR